MRFTLLTLLFVNAQPEAAPKLAGPLAKAAPEELIASMTNAKSTFKLSRFPQCRNMVEFSSSYAGGE